MAPPPPVPRKLVNLVPSRGAADLVAIFPPPFGSNNEGMVASRVLGTTPGVHAQLHVPV